MAVGQVKIGMLILTTTVMMSSLYAPALVEGHSMIRYKSCLYECLHCVKTWGKARFNGEGCAKNCHKTSGDSIDSTCELYFNRASRRVSVQPQYLHLDDTRRVFRNSFSNGYSNGYLGSRGFRASPSYLSGGDYRDQVSSCQEQCKQCESQLTASMDPHTCMYNCIKTSGEVIQC